MKKKNISSPWKLLKESTVDYQKNWWSYARVVLVVEAPVGILSIWLTADASFSAYSTIIALLVNMAVIFTILSITDNKKRPSLKESYYQGTSRFVTFFLTLVMLGLAIIPALIGLYVYSLAAITSDGYSAPIAQQIFGMGVGLLIALPTYWMFVRWVFAPYEVMINNLSQIAAIKASRSITLGRYWKVFGRLLCLLIVVILVAVLVALPAVLLGQMTGLTTAMLAIFQIISTCVVLPFAHIYLIKLYHSLKSESV